MWLQEKAIIEPLISEKKAISKAAYYFGRRDLDRIYMTGCGDSIASMIAVHDNIDIFKQVLGIPCEPIQT